jgi:hypothetical protein
VTARSCRIAGVARAHTHALLDIFHRSSMASMITDSNCIISLPRRTDRIFAGGPRCCPAGRGSQNGRICYAQSDEPEEIPAAVVIATVFCARQT